MNEPNQRIAVGSRWYHPIVQVVLAWIWEDVDVEWVKKSVVFDLLNDGTVEMVVVVVQEGIPTSVILLSY